METDQIYKKQLQVHIEGLLLSAEAAKADIANIEKEIQYQKYKLSLAKGDLSVTEKLISFTKEQISLV